ncbi:hypothetical protein [Pedobacter sp. CFBP9032]|uniref:hypothetical protein n=1 Tax=Pedobacter sp. CFBP9032 TaxID=3096539 RepID=UPI002A6AAEC6|nr:hypothetical protein [Pedobacter sp. CFBP9032]MDY0906571.1 hypothetical protein [Pedobacter sp. CFBP9032]
MACNPLEAFTNANCGAVKAGVKDNYIIAYADLVTVVGSTEVFSTSVNGIVNAIGVGSGKHFVKVKNTKKTGAFKETSALADNGVETNTIEYTLSIDSFSAENKKFTESLSGREVVVLAKLKSGKYAALGLEGGFYLSGSELTVDEATNSRALTFTGEAVGFVPEVDATLIASLTA